MDYGKALSTALRFSFQPKRWLPFFILDTVMFFLFMAVLISNAGALSAAEDSPEFVIGILGILGAGGLIFLVWFLMRIYIMGAIIHQSFKSTGDSWKVSRERYLSILGVVIVTGLISGIVGAVPYLGWVFSIVAGLAFFFAMQPVIIDKKPFVKSIKISYNMFKKRTIEVLIAWILITVITLILTALFSVVLLASFWNFVFPTLSGTQSFRELLNIVTTNMANIIPGAIVFIVGMGISTVFATCAQTKLYLQIKKR